MITFSFILPTLNAAGPLFERALHSIRDQDYPQDLVEIVVADGGSTDNTREIARAHNCTIVENPRRLAEFGVQEAVAVAQGELYVTFAYDNELVGHDWLRRVGRLFQNDPDLAAVFGRLVSGEGDAPLNKYVELIQSEPLNWFLNRNLEPYLASAPRAEVDPSFFVFTVAPGRPLVWGANGFVTRTEWGRPHWLRDGYVGDVDAFHAMLQDGHRKVAYSPAPYCYHHHVSKLGDMRRKWLRNSRYHLTREAPNRDLNWVYVPGFRRRSLAWAIYSLVPVFSTVDAVRRAWRDRSIYWLYHPLATALQAITYVEVFLGTQAGRDLLKRSFLRAR